MEVRRGYKLTDLGLIPDDWINPKLESIGSVIRGSSPRPKGDKRYYGGNVPRLMVEDVTRDKRWVTPCIDYLTVEGAKLSRPCKRGTLTIVCSGTPTVVGLPSLLAVDACIHDGMLALVNLDSTVVPDFLFHQLLSLQEKLHAAATHGGTFVNLTTAGLRAFKVVLPPTKVEQEAIAEALSDADALIESLEQLIAKKRQLKQGAMQELLTGKRRLPGFSGKWEVKQLGELLSIKHGRSQHGISNPNGPYPIMATGGQIGTATHYLYDKPSVLIGRKGTIDQPRYMDTPFWSVDTLFYSVIIEPNDAKFLYYRFCLIDWKQHNEASGVPSLNAKTIERIQVLTPKYPEQSAIATILSDMDAEIAALEIKLAKTRQIKQGMMQELLTGRIRLV